MLVKKRLLFAILPLLIYACQPDPDYLDLEAYYFPYKTLEEGMVYEYESATGDSLDTEYWFYKSVKDDEGWHLVGNFYDHNLQVRQLYRIDLYESGGLIADYFIYVSDSTGKQMRYAADIGSPNAFPFQLKDSTSVLVSELTWTFNEAPLHRTSIVRNRQYNGRVQFKFKGETYEAVKFENKEMLDDDNEGHLETVYNGLEVYAKGLGLVYYHKEIGDQMDLQYQLKAIYPMSELEAKFKTRNEAVE